MKPKIIDTAYLYIREDGSEVWHKPFKPQGPSLLVDLIRISGKRYLQRTYTRLVYRVSDVVAHHAIIVKPRGAGWAAVGFQSDMLVLWQRPDADWPEGPRSIVPGNREEVV